MCEPIHKCRPRRQPVVALVTRIGAVAAEYFVTAIAGQHHGHVLTRDFRYEVGRHCRFVSERLIEPFLQVRQQITGGGLRKHALMMLCAEQAGDFARERSFGLLVGIEADREGRHVGAEPGSRGDDGAGIDAAGKEETERHVGNHLVPNGLVDQSSQFLGGLIDGDSARLFRNRYRPE